MSFFHFLQPVGKLLRGDEKPGGGAFGFLRDVSSDVGKVATTPYNLTRLGAANVLNVPSQAKAARKDLGGAQKVAQDYITRPTLQLGQSLVGGDTINPDEVRHQELFKALFGDQPISSIQDTYGQARESGRGIPAALGIAGLTAVGDVPFLPSSKVAKSLAKATTAAEVKKLVPGIADDAARAISITKDRHAIENILSKTKPSVPATTGEVIPPPKVNPMQDVVDAIQGKTATAGQPEGQGLGYARRQVVTSIKTQRGKRLEASKQTGLNTQGSPGYFQEVSAMGGKYERPEIGGMIENVGPQRAEELFTNVRKQVQDLPDSIFATYIKQNRIKGLEPRGARLNLQTALRKVIFGEQGGIPTTGELKLINHVSPELGVEIASRTPKYHNLSDFAAQLFGLPRALKATLDLSMGGRQGILVAARHPVIWAKANKESFKYFGNSKYYKDEMQALRDRPSYASAQRYGVRTPALEAGHEEQFASAQLAEKIPVAKHAVLASARAYDGGLTRMRIDLWESLLNKYGGAGTAEKNLGQQGMKDLAEVVNTMTGRGGKKGGFVEKHMKSLSTTLFSPRLWASRLNTLNPQYYARLTPVARKEALQTAGSFAAVAGAALTAAAAAGAEVNTDPRNADFLKVKVGDTRYDILGGFQQNLVFAWRELSGEKVSSQTGKVTKFSKGVQDIFKDTPTPVDTGITTTSRLGVASDILGNKLNPALSSAFKLTEGKDKSGQPVNPLTEIGQLFVPLNLQGAYETIKHTNGGELNARNIVEGVAKNIPNTFGVGTQSYGIQDLPTTEKQKDYINRLQKQGASPDQVTATKSFYQNLKVGASDRQGTYDKYKEAIISGDTQTAIQIANDYNEKLAQALDKWDAQYSKYATEDLKAEFRRQKITPTKASIRSILREENKSTRELQLVP